MKVGPSFSAKMVALSTVLALRLRSQWGRCKAFLTLILMLTSAGQALAASCSGLAHLQVPGITVVRVESIDSGVLPLPEQSLTALPRFCRVRGVATPVPGSRIGFEVWLPLDAWSERLHMIGNGGYSSDINYLQMARIIRAGDVAVATNTGHEEAGDEPSFAIGRPESVIDWGHRAVHESVFAAKAIAKAFFSRAPRYSYFSGCSTGGQQALMSAQRYPADFNGIIAGAPGNNRGPLMMSFLWMYLNNHRPGDDEHQIVPKEKLDLLTRAVTQACDSLDGVVDGVINDPRACHFDLRTLWCNGAEKPECLTPAQLRAVSKMYEGPRDSRTGRQIYPGYPFGSEGVPAYTDDRPGWSEYWADPENPHEPRRADFFRYFAFHNQAWDWWKFNWGSDVDAVNDGVGELVDATNPSLSAFRAHGGKLIVYMGWSDPVGAATEAINYYNSVEAIGAGSTIAAKRRYTQETLRLYMVPGMVHCNGGPGASNFSSDFGNPPTEDPKHDIILALERWVEQGSPPEDIIATKYRSDDKTKRQIQFQRPICVYPKVARYKGGTQNSATSFECEDPQLRDK